MSLRKWLQIKEFTDSTEINVEKATDKSQTNTVGNYQVITQFHHSQPSEISCKEVNDKRNGLDINDTVESICEGLEYNNGKLEVSQLRPLSSAELRKVISKLYEKLSVRGLYNLCCSMTKMNDEEKARYTGQLCTDILLPKISNLEQSSILILAAIKECAEKITDDVQKFVFLPLLNLDIKDITVVSTFLNTIDLQRRKNFLKLFCSTVKELKAWHTSVLLILLSTNVDPDTKARLIDLLSQKALCFCTDKSYGKVVLSLLKTHPPFSPEQKDSLQQIASVNKTLYRQPIKNILRIL